MSSIDGTGPTTPTHMIATSEETEFATESVEPFPPPPPHEARTRASTAASILRMELRRPAVVRRLQGYPKPVTLGSQSARPQAGGWLRLRRRWGRLRRRARGSDFGEEWGATFQRGREGSC